ncbi:hypothetical protein [Curvivirga sp.]|uniref:hypothetical protein n=1 Tax=Curvivirga sp. TaxID=2856848 RepID=UPI003B58F256
MTKYFFSLFAIILLFQNSALADVTAVNASPSVVQVNLKGSSRVTITWAVTRFFDPAGGGSATDTILSNNASLTINGVSVDTVGSSLSLNTTLAANETRTFTFSDTFTISPAIAARIAKASAGSVRISRTFEDREGNSTGSANVALGADPAGQLSLRRIELVFSNNSHTAVINKDDQIRAVAKVKFRSSGLFRGEWRVVDPTGSLGGSNGRLLKRIRQQLVSTGEGETQIVSPPLPSDLNGLHKVVLIIEDTDANVSAPELRYFVLESTDGKYRETMEMNGPANNADLTKETTFSWQPVNGALAYQLEVFSVQTGQRITGRLVPGTDVKMNLTNLSLDNLQSGERYDWYIRAFGREGRVLAISETQTLFVP